jgi:DNA-binding transcriptional regulator/RsmH inhibitor MraZ
MLEYPFCGSAVAAVDQAGRLALPSFLLETLNRRLARDALLIGRHEADPCLVAYDRAHVASIHADVERRRLIEEQAAPHLHHARARRAFGFVEPAAIEQGRLTLPALMRRRAAVGAHALIVGTGGTFEIWDADLARERGDTGLRELAAFHLHNKLAA